MLFTVRMYVGWRALWMLLKVVSVCGLVFFIVDVTNMWGWGDISVVVVYMVY